VILTVFDRFCRSISTIEDPVENKISDIKQTQVDIRSGLTFSSALRSFLRQDPDIIMVGEVRDIETAQIMFQAAETGHLIVATLHVKDIRGVITRLEFLGVDREKILNQLRGVLVQKLIRVVCKACRGKGCPDCFGRGYTSRTVVSECVYLRGREQVLKLMQPEAPNWWDSIIDDAYKKYRAGITDRVEMVYSFGTDFVEYEEDMALSALELVNDGKLTACQFKADFPANHVLIERFLAKVDQS
jgi:general secretion pathway protein E